MSLNELRNIIDDIDGRIQSLFIKRMDICREIAEFKKINNLPVFQGGREAELIKSVRERSPDDLKDGSAVLFQNIMDISKSIQQQSIQADFTIKPQKFIPGKAQKIGCQGLSGSYQEKACRKLFGSKEITHFHSFEDVFIAVQNGDVDFGVLPIQNSTAGSVAETYDLMRKYNFFICSRIQTEITHCLAVKQETEPDSIKQVYSHEQALAQCSEFLYKKGYEKCTFANTAAAAKYVLESNEPIGAICSTDCAKEYGLKILKNNIANISPNHTRFICISKEFYSPEKPDIISVSLAIPNTKGSLYRLLTKFSVNNLDLEHIESKPILDGSFDVIFYLDFHGDINDTNIAGLLNELKNELPYFKFLGNYNEIL